jgi:uncharacterized repeat protein (TIGR01451 family)
VRTQQGASNAGHSFKVKVIDLVDRSFSPAATVTVRASSDPLAIAGTGAPEAFPVRLPIAAGQGIAMWSADGYDCGFSTSDAGDQVLFNGDPEPGAGTSISAQDGGMNERVPLQATIEPDADGDGFGDETQDQCPSDAASHAPCVADVGLTGSVTPSTIGVGDVAVLVGSVTNAGPATAAGVALHVTPPAGLQIVSSVPSAGCTFTTALTCGVGDLLKSGATPVAVVFKGIKTGAQKITASADSTAIDSNPANNGLAADVTVQQRVPLVCAVPSLKGLSKGFAKKLLAATHCKLGKVTKKKSKKGKKGTVIKQSPKAGSTLAAGAKVKVTVRK